MRAAVTIGALLRGLFSLMLLLVVGALLLPIRGDLAQRSESYFVRSADIFVVPCIRIGGIAA